MATGSLSTLELRVDAQSVETATAALVAMARAGRGAQDSTTALGATSTSSASSIANQVSALQIQAGALGMSAREAKLLELAVNGASRAQIDSANAALKAIESHKAASAAQAAAAKETAAAQAAANRESERSRSASAQAASSIDSHIRSLRTQAATYSMSSREAKLFELASRGATAAQIASADALLRNIDAQRKQLGASAAQTANAIRMVPAQMTDIVTQLAGGQNPFLILIQQGGQIKDSFNGIGPMFKELFGLITPTMAAITLGVAAVAAIGIAFFQATGQTNEFNKSLILSGNFVGKTTAQMFEMSNAVEKATGSQRGAAQSLALVAASGKIGAESMQSVATAAVLMEKATGQAYKETVDQAVKLGDDPVRASAKLNESMHHLTASTFARIQALKESGREDDAAALAQTTYANAVKDRAQEVINTLGPVERAWMDLKSAAAGAWGEMVKGVLPDDLQTKLGKLQRDAEAYAKGRAETGNTTMGPQETAARKEAASVQASLEAGQKQAKRDSEHAAADKASIKSQQEVNSLLESGGKREEKLARALEKNAERFSKILPIKGDANLDSAVLAKQKAQIDANIREQYKPPSGPKRSKSAAPRQGESALDAMAKQIRTESKNYEETNDVSELDRKINALNTAASRDKKGLAGNSALVAELTATMTATQALKDAKLLAAAADEKALADVRENRKDMNEEYQEQIGEQKVLLESKQITETQYNESMRGLREAQLSNLQASSDREMVILNAAKSKALSVRDQIAVDKSIEESLRGAATEVRNLQKEASKDDLRLLKKTLDEIKKVTEEMRTPLERYRDELEKLDLQKSKGLGDLTYERARKKAWNEYADAVEKVGGSISTMEDLAKGVASSIQDNLGTATAALVSGKFDEMFQSFSKMTQNMLAKAIEAKLSNALFGDRPGNTGGGGLLDMIMGTGSTGTAASGGGGGGGGGFLSSIGSWIGSLFSFDGGGDTPSGARSGGMDGKGGFLAVMHPNETVIDNTKSRPSGAGGNMSVAVQPSITVNVINNGAPVKEEGRKQRSDGNGGSIIDIFLSAAANDVRSGGGLADAMQGTYGLNRSAGAMT